MARRQPAWHSWSMRNLKDSELRGIPRGTHHSDLTPKQRATLQGSYKSHQYNRLRAAGVNRPEAITLRKTDPRTVATAIKDRRTYAQEMVSRYRGTTTGSAFRKEVKKMLKDMGQKEYTMSDWAAFAEWYSSHMKGFPFKDAQAPRMGRPQSTPTLPALPWGIPESPKKEAAKHAPSKKAQAKALAAAKKAYLAALAEEVPAMPPRPARAKPQPTARPAADVSSGTAAKKVPAKKGAVDRLTTVLFRDAHGRFTTKKSKIKTYTVSVVQRDARGRFI